tara:strand:- start:2344 stop:3087 length:744 start_codon:yes stop_codon:yes gene_type:complete
MQAIRTIRDRSDRITFDEEFHVYHVNGTRVGKSVSRYASSPWPRFQALRIASRCGAQKRLQWTNNAACTDAELAAAWDKNGAAAAAAGTKLHADIERFFVAGENSELCPVISGWMQRKFPRDLVTTFPELIIAGPLFEGGPIVAGTIDLLCYDRRELPGREWGIYDWKRGAVSSTGGDLDELGMGVRGSKHRIYSVQLALYAQILRLSYGIDAKRQYIVHTIEGSEPEMIEPVPDAAAIAEVAAMMN